METLKKWAPPRQVKFKCPSPRASYPIFVNFFGFLGVTLPTWFDFMSKIPQILFIKHFFMIERRHVLMFVTKITQKLHHYDQIAERLPL